MAVFLCSWKGVILTLDKILQGESQNKAPKEGEFYKEVSVDGKIFKLYYGYYEELDKDSVFNEPIPIYPDLASELVYTLDGFRIVTAMQDVCGRYNGKDGGDSCDMCVYFEKNAELFGICRCYGNKMKSTDNKSGDIKNE